MIHTLFACLLGCRTLLCCVVCLLHASTCRVCCVGWVVCYVVKSLVCCVMYCRWLGYRLLVYLHVILFVCLYIVISMCLLPFWCVVYVSVCWFVDVFSYLCVCLSFWRFSNLPPILNNTPHITRQHQPTINQQPPTPQYTSYHHHISSNIKPSPTIDTPTTQQPATDTIPTQHQPHITNTRTNNQTPPTHH